MQTIYLRSQQALSSHSSTLSKCLPVCTGELLLDITMSFGFSVGDFLAAIQLANKIRKDFADAPSQFKAISDEYVV